jgi:hypothetical protein
MWSNWKMKFVAFIHNDDVKCFAWLYKETHKLVAMGCINFELHVSNKRQWASKKMNAIGGMFNNKQKGNCRK